MSLFLLVVGSVLVIVGGSVLGTRAGRRRRARDLALLAVARRAAAGPPGADRWRPLADALLEHYRARRVVLRLPPPEPAATVAGTSTAGSCVLLCARVAGASSLGDGSATGGIEVHGPRRRAVPHLRGAGPLVPGARSRVLDAVAAEVGAAEVGAAEVGARVTRGGPTLPPPLPTPPGAPGPGPRPESGLLTRAEFLAALTERPGGLPAAVVVLDVATLVRVVGGTLGTQGADRALVLAAARVAAAAGRIDPRPDPGSRPAPGSRPDADALPGVGLPARLCADGFAVALDASDPGAAVELARSLRARLVAPYVVDGLPFTALVAVGLATSVDLPAPTDAAATTRAGALVGRADVARRAALADHGVRLWDPMLGERADRRIEILRGFGAAVAGGGLGVHFQPVVSLRSSTVLGVEALARWQHPELGLLVPDEFVPVLEATGHAPTLTAVVLEASLEAARSWLDAGLRLGVAVNVPVAQLDDPGFPDAVAAALHRHGVCAELLTLELTESGVSAERAAALPVLRRLRGLGCRLSLDDFGTGQSSLAHLRGLPVDQVKIDKSFVLGMDTDPDDAALVRAIIGMGHTLGLTVVAEGVERESVRAALTAMGCDVAQGFGVSRAMSAEELRGWLDAREVREGERGPRTLLA